MISLAQIKETGLAEAMGMTPTDSRFISYLNTGVERVMQAGNWKGTIKKMRLRVSEGNRIYVPKNVLSVEKFSVNGVPVKLHGPAFEFMEGGNGVYQDLNCRDRCWRCSSDIVDQESSATMATLAVPSNITAISDAAECAGTSITIKGYDGMGNWVRSQDANGCWSDGVTLLLDGTEDTNPPTTKLLFLEITEIVKDETKGVVTVSANHLNGGGIELAKLDPIQRTSEYRLYTIPAPICGPCAPGRIPCIMAIVKMAFVPVKNDRDTFLIDLMSAIKDAAWSQYYADKPEGFQLQAAKLASAMAALDQQLGNYRGAGQVNPINVVDDGSAGASRIFPVYGGSY